MVAELDVDLRQAHHGCRAGLLARGDRLVELGDGPAQVFGVPLGLKNFAPQQMERA